MKLKGTTLEEPKNFASEKLNASGRRRDGTTPTKDAERKKIYELREVHHWPFDKIAKEFTPHISRQRAYQQYLKYVEALKTAKVATEGKVEVIPPDPTGAASGEPSGT